MNISQACDSIIRREIFLHINSCYFIGHSIHLIKFYKDNDENETNILQKIKLGPMSEFCDSVFSK